MLDVYFGTDYHSHYGYPSSTYAGMNVEVMRYRNGAALARKDGIAVDMVAGIPDSGVGHAIGYSNESRIPYGRPFIKYTPTWSRSFMPQDQKIRNLVARMNKYLNFSASRSHMDLATRQAILELEGHEPESLQAYCDPQAAQYQAMVDHIGKKLNFSSLKYQTIHDMVEAIGIGAENICTYCWNGKE